MAANEASEKANRAKMDPKRLLALVFLALGAVLALFLGRIFDLFWAWMGWSNPPLFAGLGWRLTSLMGFILAAGAVGWAYLAKRPREYAEEAASELMRVVWPPWAEVRVSTMAVVITAFVAAAFFFVVDTLSYEIMVEWLPRLWELL